MELEKRMYKDAVNKWGVEAQVNMCMEECAELIVACNKYLRAKTVEEIDEAIVNFAEEVADVEIMISQMKEIINNNKTFKDAKIKKLKRAYKRLYGKEPEHIF
jgi:predicted small metal-binding protein